MEEVLKDPKNLPKVSQWSSEWTNNARRRIPAIAWSDQECSKRLPRRPRKTPKDPLEGSLRCGERFQEHFRVPKGPIETRKIPPKLHLSDRKNTQEWSAGYPEIVTRILWKDPKSIYIKPLHRFELDSTSALQCLNRRRNVREIEKCRLKTFFLSCRLCKCVNRL